MKNYRKEVQNILEISKKILDSKKYDEVYHYFDNGEEELSIDLLVSFLNNEKYIPYRLAVYLVSFFDNFPADDVYIQIVPVDELVNKIKESRVDLN